jgi:hypothetical protein
LLRMRPAAGSAGDNPPLQPTMHNEANKTDREA